MESLLDSLDIKGKGCHRQAVGDCPYRIRCRTGRFSIFFQLTYPYISLSKKAAKQTTTANTHLIASPNCTTTGLVMTLAALRGHYTPTEIFFCSYQAISGGGKKLLEDFHTPGSLYAGNCVPQIGSIQPSGYTSEELKGIFETRKILDLPNVKVYPHTVRVGVENSHSLGVTAKLDKPADLDEIKNLMNAFPNLKYTDDIVTPKQVSGQETTYACRLRRDLYEPNVIHYFITFDNLLKGAAMNARQIVELLLEKF